jgi:hypothetical protein
MSQAIDIEAWRRDGEKMWAAIHERKLLVIWWNNPWRRFAAIGLVLVVAAVVVGIAMRAYILTAVLAAASLPFLYTAVKYFRVGLRTGGLYSFFSERGFGIGCDADRLSIPYSSIVLPESVNPGTVNENYIVLPIAGGTEGVVIERKVRDDLPWDGATYARGIASVFLKDNQVRVRAYPNEMIVHLFSAIYPLSIYLSRRANKTPPPAAD